MVGAVTVEFARSRIERQHHLVARVVAGGLDRLSNEAEGGISRAQVWRKTTLIADIGVVTGIGELASQGVEDFGADPDGFGHRARADRHHHELLDVDRIDGMNPAVEDVHHWHW